MTRIEFDYPIFDALANEYYLNVCAEVDFQQEPEHDEYGRPTELGGGDDCMVISCSFERPFSSDARMNFEALPEKIKEQIVEMAFEKAKEKQQLDYEKRAASEEDYFVWLASRG